MIKNVGPSDKMVRLVLALAIGAVGIYFNTLWGLLAIVPLVTAMFNFCPLYMICGLSSCKIKKS
jgi:hypothetical protein